MRKNKGIKRRVPTPDYKYNNPIVSKFINYLMSDGKKNVARTVVYDAFDIVAEQTKKGRPMRERLADELIAAAKNEGDAVRKKENTERMAAANKAFAHFA